LGFEYLNCGFDPSLVCRTTNRLHSRGEKAERESKKKEREESSLVVVVVHKRRRRRSCCCQRAGSKRGEEKEEILHPSVRPFVRTNDRTNVDGA
jgi:hypothetical protein